MEAAGPFGEHAAAAVAHATRAVGVGVRCSGAQPAAAAQQLDTGRVTWTERFAACLGRARGRAAARGAPTTGMDSARRAHARTVRRVVLIGGVTVPLTAALAVGLVAARAALRTAAFAIHLHDAWRASQQRRRAWWAAAGARARARLRRRR